MNSAVIDTNVFVYAYTEQDPDKGARARQLLRRLGPTGRGFVPVQVLAEFSNVALRKSVPRLDPDTVYARLNRIAHAFQVAPLTPQTVREAVRGVRDHKLAYYDAQIWAAARQLEASYVLSEDFNASARIGGVTFVNPFADDDVVERL